MLFARGVEIDASGRLDGNIVLCNVLSVVLVFWTHDLALVCDWVDTHPNDIDNEDDGSFPHSEFLHDDIVAQVLEVETNFKRSGCGI